MPFINTHLNCAYLVINIHQEIGKKASTQYYHWREQNKQSPQTLTKTTLLYCLNNKFKGPQRALKFSSQATWVTQLINA